MGDIIKQEDAESLGQTTVDCLFRLIWLNQEQAQQILRLEAENRELRRALKEYEERVA